MKKLFGLAVVVFGLIVFATIVLAVIGNPSAQFILSCAGRGFQNCRKWG